MSLLQYKNCRVLGTYILDCNGFYSRWYSVIAENENQTKTNDDSNDDDDNDYGFYYHYNFRYKR